MEIRMKGLMQDWPLLTSQVLKHVARWHGEREVVSRDFDGNIHRESYLVLERRAGQVAAALSNNLGIQKGEFIGTMAPSTIRHLEAWYGIMGMGAVVHTVNPRLFEGQIAYTINHAEDTWLFVDPLYVPIVERLQNKLPTIKGYIVLCDRQHMPATTLRSLHCYEELIAASDEGYEWPAFDENNACGLCYTSGTTGEPKGVLYSHRSQMLHALIQGNGDGTALSSRDRMAPFSPLYHVSA
jgi:acyl-CoA synthetase (AMP-forming)/AMP-acid ligase II